MRRSLVAFAFVAPLAFVVPLALAQRAAVPSSGAPAAAGRPAPKETTPAPASSAAAGEADGDEADRPAPPPSPVNPSAGRQAVPLKDGMLRIPGGRFTMGTSDKNAPPNERPARSVSIPAFWIDRTEVTVAAYRACVDRGACPRPPSASPSCTFDLGDPLLPISCVGWASAKAYCTSVNKRLPREVEWENAARGTTPIRYPWGGGHGCGVAATMVGESTSRSCSGRQPSRVGVHLSGASPYGVQDMSGNVEEWVADWYAATAAEASPRSGASHVLRGGGWLSPPSRARTTTRNWGSVREAGPNVGFRCARDDVPR